MSLKTLKKNLTLLDKYHGTLYQKLRQNHKKDSTRISLQETPSKLKTLLVCSKKGDFYLHSKFDPIKEARIKVDYLLEENINSVFIFGAGLGFHLKELIKRVPYGTPLILIEPSWKIFKETLRSDFASETLLYPKLELLIGEDLQKLKWKLKKLIYTNRIGSFRKLSLESSEKFFSDYFHKVSQMINAHIQDLNNAYKEFARQEKEIQQNYATAGEPISIETLCYKILETKERKSQYLPLELIFLNYYKMMELRKQKETLPL